MFNKLDHIEVVVADLDASLAFYVDKLGFSLLSQRRLDSPHFDHVVMLGQNQVRIELLCSRSALPLPNKSIYRGFRLAAFEINCMRDTLNVLQTQDIEITWGPKTIDNYVRAEIEDPDGNPIELRQLL